MAESLYADRARSVCSGMDVKWSAAEVYKRNSMKREITEAEGGSQAGERTLPYWVAALIQQQTDPEKDHLSPLWSPYKSSTFPLFSSAAHKLIKLAFPCCSWQKECERHPARCTVLWVVEGCANPTHTDPHTHRTPFSFDGVDHKAAILTRMIHVQLLLTAE